MPARHRNADSTTPGRSAIKLALRQFRRTVQIAAWVLVPVAGWPAEPPKPNVFIAATGGKIAGTQTNVEQHGYTAGQLGIASLIAAVPQIRDIATVTGDQVMNILSQDISDADWLKLAKRLEELERSDAGAKGLIVAGVGDGNFTNDAFAGLRAARARGVVVVRSTRVAAGFTVRNAEVDDNTEGFVAAAEFKPSKARVILQIALLKTASPAEIQNDFDTW